MRKSQRDAIDLAHTLDCRFFLEKADRQHRIRPSVPGETDHPANNFIVCRYVSFDGQTLEVQQREGRFDSLPLDDERFAAWAWDHLLDMHERGVRGEFAVDPDAIAAAKVRVELPSSIAALLGKPSPDPVRMAGYAKLLQHASRDGGHHA